LWGVLARSQRARVRLLSGDAAGCVTEMVRAGGGPELLRIDGHHRLSCLTTLAFAAFLLEDTASARHWARLAEDCAGRSGLRTSKAYSHLAASYVLMADGDLDGAAARARRAAEIFGAAEAPVAMGRAHLAAGLALAESDRERADTELYHAKNLFAGAGARWWHGRVVLEQKRLGGRRGRNVRGPVLSRLTDRERQIAGLLAEGMTNREIATTLAISTKTVEKRLSQVFARLGVSSRVAAAAVIAVGGGGT
ncbi:helix-turn-helix transcriptional regulator, partial [Actinocorallia lasiicapitis]